MEGMIAMNMYLHRNNNYAQFVVDKDGRLICGTCRKSANECLARVRSEEAVAPVTEVDLRTGQLSLGAAEATVEDSWLCLVCARPAVLPVEFGRRERPSATGS